MSNKEQQTIQEVALVKWDLTPREKISILMAAINDPTKELICIFDQGKQSTRIPYLNRIHNISLGNAYKDLTNAYGVIIKKRKRF